MKETELMIGDLVYVYTFPNENPHQEDLMSARLIGVNSDEVDNNPTPFCEGITISTNGIFSRPVDTIIPIPLTQEILEKNGWTYEHDKQDYMVKYDLGCGGENRWMMWSIKYHNLDVEQQNEELNSHNLCTQRVVITCDYVHELQHALRLCGMNDLANNFKVK